MLIEEKSEHEKENIDQKQRIDEDNIKSTSPHNWIVEALKKLLDWTKNYLATCILLISGLGAIIQISNLILIDISYIRFFSSSQLIPDGALALAITIILIGSYKIGEFIFLSEERQQIIRKHSKEDRGYIKKFVYTFIPIIGFMIYAVIALYVRTKPGYTIYTTAVIGFTVPILMVSMLHWFEYSTHIEQKKDATKKEKDLAAFTNVTQVGISSITIIFYLLVVVTMGLKAYKVPIDLENISKVRDRIEKDYGNVETYEILYFNDKYLFVRLSRKGNKTVAVYDSNEVMFDKNIIVNQPSK